MLFWMLNAVISPHLKGWEEKRGDCVACSVPSPKTALGMLDFTVALL